MDTPGVIAQVVTGSDSPAMATAELVESPMKSGDIGNALTDIPTKANVLSDEEELKLKQQTDTVMRCASHVLCREYLERFNGWAHCELDVIKEELRSLVYSTLLRVPVDERDRNVAQVRDSALASLGSMDELMEMVRVVPGEKKKRTFKSEETRQKAVDAAKRMTQSKNDANRGGNSLAETYFMICDNSTAIIASTEDHPNDDNITWGQCLKFRKHYNGVKVMSRSGADQVMLACGRKTKEFYPVSRRLGFRIMVEVKSKSGGRTKLVPFTGSPLSLNYPVILEHDTFRKGMPKEELKLILLDDSIKAPKREANELKFGIPGMAQPKFGSSQRQCREKNCTAMAQPNKDGCCKTHHKEFKDRYESEGVSAEEGWEAERRDAKKPITKTIHCTNQDKGCDWFCQSNERRSYATHVGHCNRKMAVSLCKSMLKSTVAHVNLTHIQLIQ